VGVAQPVLLGAQVAPVAVRLTEFQIEMPTCLPAGLTTFSVTNAGQMEHNFEIKSVLEEEAPGEQPLPPNLQPGETRTIQVELTLGAVPVRCAVWPAASRSRSPPHLDCDVYRRPALCCHARGSAARSLGSSQGNSPRFRHLPRQFAAC